MQFSMKFDLYIQGVHFLRFASELKWKKKNLKFSFARNFKSTIRRHHFSRSSNCFRFPSESDNGLIAQVTSCYRDSRSRFNLLQLFAIFSSVSDTPNFYESSFWLFTTTLPFPAVGTSPALWRRQELAGNSQKPYLALLSLRETRMSMATQSKSQIEMCKYATLNWTYY